MSVNSYKSIIALGSNLGNRLQHLNQARSFLSSLPNTVLTASSPIYESEPVGPAEYSFLNAVLSLQTSITPILLLRLIKQFETNTGRNLNSTPWSNRPIDIDIITFGSYFINLPFLQIPHIHYSKRLFVLLPLNVIEPGWIDPVSKIPISELIRLAEPLDIMLTNTQW